MATPTDDDNADGCIAGNYYGYERGGTLEQGLLHIVCSSPLLFFDLQISQWSLSVGGVALSISLRIHAALSWVWEKALSKPALYASGISMA